MTKRSADFGRPLVPFREYAAGVLRGSFGEPVIAVRRHERPDLFRDDDGQALLPLVAWAGSGFRDDDGVPVAGVSFYSGSDFRTADGRVIFPFVRYGADSGLPVDNIYDRAGAMIVDRAGSTLFVRF